MIPVRRLMKPLSAVRRIRAPNCINEKSLRSRLTLASIMRSQNQIE